MKTRDGGRHFFSFCLDRCSEACRVQRRKERGSCIKGGDRNISSEPHQANKQRATRPGAQGPQVTQLGAITESLSSPFLVTLSSSPRVVPLVVLSSHVMNHRFLQLGARFMPSRKMKLRRFPRFPNTRAELKKQRHK